MLHRALRRLLPLLLVLPRCAGIQDSYLATPVDEQGRLIQDPRTRSGLIVSGDELSEYASENFGLLEFTIENRSAEWLRISRMALDFGGAEQNAGVYLPAGLELDAWYSATQQRNDIRETNQAIALEALFLAGNTLAAVGAASQQRGLSAAGRLAALGAFTVAEVDAHGERTRDVEQVQAVPDTHLLALPMSIPPGLFTKRWLLLNTRDYRTPCIRTVLLDYDVELGGLAIGATRSAGRERVLLRFRTGGARSEWQRSLCQATP